LRLISDLRVDATWSWLQKHRLSLDDFEELVYATVISSKLAQHLFANKVEPFLLSTSSIMLRLLCMKWSWTMKMAMELFYALQEGEISFPEVPSIHPG